MIHLLNLNICKRVHDDDKKIIRIQHPKIGCDHLRLIILMNALHTNSHKVTKRLNGKTTTTTTTALNNDHILMLRHI